MSISFLDRKGCVEKLRELRFHSLADRIEQVCPQRFSIEHHGSLSGWKEAYNLLPNMLPNVAARFDASGDVVRVLPVQGNSVSTTPNLELADEGQDSLRKTLMRFHPWRKGPLELFGVSIDTEWHSCLKWNRLASEIDFDRKLVLDVGSGNGYYGWKMLAAGASMVLGCEPFLLSVAQFEVFRKYWPDDERHYVVPLADVDLPRDIQRFDITCSMGVLYHRPNPIEHLQILASTLKAGGELLLETIVLEDAQQTVLVPEDRYAKMRNVWFIPSVAMLELWLRRTGFDEIRVIDVSRTTSQEQRRTDWMTFESLSDFLDPTDSSRTIEGYPSPSRAVIIAKKR